MKIKKQTLIFLCVLNLSFIFAEANIEETENTVFESIISTPSYTQKNMDKKENNNEEKPSNNSNWGILEWATIISAIIGLISMVISISQAIYSKKHAKSAENIKEEVIQIYKNQKHFKKIVAQEVNLTDLLNKLKNLDVGRLDIKADDPRLGDFYNKVRTINETQIDTDVKVIIDELFKYEGKQMPNSVIHKAYEDVNILVKKYETKSEGVK